MRLAWFLRPNSDDDYVVVVATMDLSGTSGLGALDSPYILGMSSSAGFICLYCSSVVF